MAKSKSSASSAVVPSIFVMHLKNVLHEKPFFLAPGISWKSQKDQASITFPSTFWLKKDRISHLRKVKNKNFPVISKYHPSIKKRPYFLSPESSKQKLSRNQ